MARRGSGDVWVEGEDRLFMNMNLVLDEVQAASIDGLKRAGMKIVGTAQRNMRTAGHNGGTLNTTGRLSQSGKVQELNDGTIDVGFFSQDGERGYAAVVEYGSRKAWWPPVDMIRAWVRKKLRVVGEEKIDRTAYLVGLTIAGKNPRKPHVHGLRPHPFFGPAVKKHRKEAEKAISEAVRKVTDKDRI